MHPSIADTSLFNRTIRENIAYSRPDATLEEVQEAAKLAYADDFIRQLPGGYDAMVGERGLRLSGTESYLLDFDFYKPLTPCC